jgi:hypothetical protein
MDPLKIDVGAEIIDLVKRLGAPPLPRRPAHRTERVADRSGASAPAAPSTEAPEPPEAA